MVPSELSEVDAVGEGKARSNSTGVVAVTMAGVGGLGISVIHAGALPGIVSSCNANGWERTRRSCCSMGADAEE